MGSTASIEQWQGGPNRRIRKKIGIIGAGPCGLSQLQAFSTYNESKGKKYFGDPTDGDAPFEVVCFEEKPSWGGQWCDRLDPTSPTSSGYDRGYLYRNEWSTNGPKECLEFADYSFRTHFGCPTPSFPSRETIFHYLSKRSENKGVATFIKFNTSVRWASFDESKSRFVVQVEDLLTSETNIWEFDYLIVATGHFTCQNIPHIEGVDSFWGPVLHVHDFGDPEDYRGKDILLVGSSCSATNVCLECLGHGVGSITISYRTDPCAIELLPNMQEKPVLLRMEGDTAFFSDGSRKDVSGCGCLMLLEA
jgi:trimethylamine monooxygenase